MTKIVIIGTGNLGTQLCMHFERSNNVELVGYFNKNSRTIASLKAPLLENFNTIPACDFILICTPDDTIASISALFITNAIVLHTSGSVSIDAVSNHKNHGVFYLPQSFSSTRTPVFEDITICMESSSASVLKKIETLGSSLSRKRKLLNSSQRKNLHLAAVFANNFVNHCYYKTEQLLKKDHLELEILEPLLRETLEKALFMGPYLAQTGPAKRADYQTLKTHKKMLQATDRTIYEAITNSILNSYGTEL